MLLQNRGVLPLKKGSKVVYIGGFAKTPRYQGGGSSHINTIRVDSALEMAESHGRRVSYVEGFPADLDQREEEEFLRAVSAAAEADAAVIFAGLPESFESEGFDRSHMRLPESQNNLIARVAAVQKNTVVVLHTGSPVECPWANDVNAVLCMYLGGEGVGAAADACCGAMPTPAAACRKPGPCGWKIPRVISTSPVTAAMWNTARACMSATAGTMPARCRCCGRLGTGFPTQGLCTAMPS